MVVEDPEILRGTPVIRGTRIPVHDVASLVDAGTPLQEILEIYPESHAVADRVGFDLREGESSKRPSPAPELPQKSHGLRFQEATSWLLYRRLGVCRKY